MARNWMPGAVTLPSSHDGGSMVGGPARAVEHTMECPYSWSALQAARFLIQQGTEVHFAFHPVSGHIVQMLPAYRAARGLSNLSGGVQTNRQGSRNLQTEVVGYAGKPWTNDVTAAAKRTLAARANFYDSHGISRVWRGGPAATYAEANARGARPVSEWLGDGGWRGHSRVPENGHWDPGAIDVRVAMGGRGGGGGKISLPSQAGAEWYVPDLSSTATIRALQSAVGVKADGIVGPKTAKAVQEWLGVKADGWWGRGTISALQRKVGAEADGVWGPRTAAALRRYLDRDADGGDDLVVDGIMGKNTVRALQKWVGSTADGIMGVRTRRALQRKLGVTADGIIGRRTVRALQRKVDTEADGVWGPNTTRHLQRFLNRVL